MTVLSDVLQDELLPGELVLWTGAPARGMRLRRSDAAMIPFSIAWCAFALFWEGSVIATGGPIFMKLWGIPFVIIGIYMVIGRFVVDSKRRERTVYAVTDRRVLIISTLFGRKVTSLARTRLPELHSETHADGRGTITFGPPSTPKNMLASPSFDFIADAKTVLAMLDGGRESAYR
jgi:hypothetical protein